MEDYFMLRDPKGNEIEVRLGRRRKKVYFKHGWLGLKQFYNLDIGVWVDLTFESSNLLLMTLKNRFYEEIEYPDHNPPVIAKLSRRVCDGSRVSFYWTSSITLTSLGVNSGFLVCLRLLLIYLYVVVFDVCFTSTHWFNL